MLTAPAVNTITMIIMTVTRALKRYWIDSAPACQLIWLLSFGGHCRGSRREPIDLRICNELFVRGAPENELYRRLCLMYRLSDLSNGSRLINI